MEDLIQESMASGEFDNLGKQVRTDSRHKQKCILP